MMAVLALNKSIIEYLVLNNFSIMNLKNIIQSLFIKITLVIILFLTIGQIAYASSMSIKPHPSLIDSNIPNSEAWIILTLKAEEKFEGKAIIINLENEKQSFDLFATDAVITSDGGFGLVDQINDSFTIGKWITLGMNEVTFEKKGERELNFIIDIPKNITPGEYAGAIVIKTKTNLTEGSGTSLNIRTQVGVRVFISIAGEVIDDFSWNNYSYKIQNNGDYVFQYDFTNDGNISTKINADIDFINKSGKIIYSEKIIDLGSLLAGSSSQPKITWKKENVPLFGSLIAKTTLHTTPVSMAGLKTYDTKEEIKKLNIMIVPWAMIGIALAIIAVIIILIIFLKKKKKQVLERAIKYKIKQGDTLQSLIEKFQIDYNQTVKINKIKAPYLLINDTEILLILSKREDVQKIKDEIEIG